MPFDPSYASAFQGVSLPQIDAQRRQNALGQLDLQATQQKVQGMMNPNATPEQLARSGNVDVANSVAQQQQVRQQNAMRYAGTRLLAVSQSQDPATLMKQLASDPNFGAAAESVGLPHPSQIDSFEGVTPDQLRQQAANLARILGATPPDYSLSEGQARFSGMNNQQVAAAGPKQETLHAIIGPDGNPILAPASQAQGRTPYTPSIFASNAPLRSAGDPEVDSFKSQILAGNASLSNVPMNLRASVAQALGDTSKQQFSPIAASRFTMAASRITHPFTNMSAYKLTADGKPYLERIDAALKNPGSVGDQDLLDSLTKLNTGGNAVTEAQVSLITHGKSFSDTVATFANKFKNGGVLSPDQRQQVHDIAYQIFENYKKGYQPIYERAAQQLTQAGIPQQFWTIPDLNSLNDGASSQPGQVPQTNARGWVLHKDAQGNQAYVSPDGKQFEEVR